MQTQKFTVHRTMQDGAKEYLPGDTREMTEADAADLVAMGALSPEGEEPIVRSPGVVHTFGEADQTGHLEMTIAGSTDKIITAPKRAAAPKA